MKQLMQRDDTQVSGLIRRCPDHLLVELILLDRPAAAEKQHYAAGEYDFYHALHNAVIEELARRYATRRHHTPAGEN